MKAKPFMSVASDWIALAVLLGLPLLLILIGLMYVRFIYVPPPQLIIADFREEGLDVGWMENLDEDEGFQASPTPKTYDQGYWFQIDSLTEAEGQPSGAKVYTFDSEEDMQAMVNYYEGIATMPTFGFALQSHLYRDERRLMLLQMPATVPNDQADEYGDVMEGSWLGSSFYRDPFR